VGSKSPLILIVDDERSFRLVLRTRLRVCGYRTVTAVDGEEAWSVARDLRPDVILLDLAMPDVDGIEFLQRLRNTAALRDTPVIVITALYPGPITQEAERLGARHVLLKTNFGLDELAAHVAALLPAAKAA